MPHLLVIFALPLVIKHQLKVTLMANLNREKYLWVV